MGKSTEHKNEGRERELFKKLDKLIEHKKTESEALKKILEGLEKIKNKKHNN